MPGRSDKKGARLRKKSIRRRDVIYTAHICNYYRQILKNATKIVAMVVVATYAMHMTYVRRSIVFMYLNSTRSLSLLVPSYPPNTNIESLFTQATWQNRWFGALPNACTFEA